MDELVLLFKYVRPVICFKKGRCYQTSAPVITKHVIELSEMVEVFLLQKKKS